MEKWLDTWEINQRMNEYLLSGIKEEYFNDQYSGKSRGVGAQFAHIHNVRLMWIKASATDLLEGLPKIDGDAPVTKHILLTAFDKSTPAMSELLRRGFDSGRIKGFKPHPEAFMGYLLAHEAHHRGQIIVALKDNGHLPDKKILYGLWEWGSH